MLYKLESLRGLAAVLVVIFHIEWDNFENKYIFFKSAWLFVDLFFVLSGFVIALAYKEKVKAGMTFYEYFILRLGRIYPLHVFVLMCWIPYIGAKFFLYHYGFGGTDPALTENVPTFLVTLFLLNSYGLLNVAGWNVPSWSISAEMFAYAFFFYICFYGVAKRKLPYWSLLVLGIMTYVLLYLLNGPSIAVINAYAFLRACAAFSIGWFVYEVYLRIGIAKGNIGLHEKFSMLLIILSVSLVAYDRYFSYAAIAVFGYTVYVFGQQDSAFIGRVLLKNWAVSLGKWSYSIYMIHLLILSGLQDIFEHIIRLNERTSNMFFYLILNAIVIGFIVFLASLTYKYIEVPARNSVKNYLVRRSEKIEQRPVGF